MNQLLLILDGTASEIAQEGSKRTVALRKLPQVMALLGYTAYLGKVGQPFLGFLTLDVPVNNSLFFYIGIPCPPFLWQL